MFTKYCKIDHSAHKEMNPKGNGLGLEISRRICKHLGGNLMVTSQVGVGSKFTFFVICQFGESVNQIIEEELKLPE